MKVVALCSEDRTEKEDNRGISQNEISILPFQNDAKVEFEGQGRMARQHGSMELAIIMLKMKTEFH